MVASAVDAHGGVDILINNAAIMVDLPPYGLADMPVEEWDRVLGVNLRGPLLCTQAAVPEMERRGGGRVGRGRGALKGHAALAAEPLPRVDFRLAARTSASQRGPALDAEPHALAVVEAAAHTRQPDRPPPCRPPQPTK